MEAPNYFISDRDVQIYYPLRGFLRIPSASVAAKYIETLTAPGDLVVDPFAATPVIARTAYTLGRRAIAVEVNPLWAWLAHAMATLPPAREIDSALAKLGDAIKDGVALRSHIGQLYATTCAVCGKLTSADYFLRAREGAILRRHYTCAHCGETRDDPATEDDVKRAEQVAARGLHYHVAFERVVPAEGLHADRIRKMLDLYTPRNLYALVTVWQKVDSLFHATRERDILLLLFIHALDRGTGFYTAPEAMPQLTVHKQFVEFNIWREIEWAAHALAQADSALDPAESPAEVVVVREPAAFVGRGNAKTLARDLPSESVALVLTVPPPRRIAIWALTYFWGAWVLGRNQVQSLTPFLDSKRDAAQEWRWYSDGLNESWKAMAHLLRTDGRVVCAFNEAWQLVIEALLLAGADAQFDLESFLFQPRIGHVAHRELDDIPGDYRITFAKSEMKPRSNGSPLRDLENRIRATALAAGRDVLAQRGEALAFSFLHHAAYARIAREGLSAQALDAKLKTTPMRFVHAAVVDGLCEGYAHDFDHHSAAHEFLWFRRAPALQPPLIDRVDDAVRKWLARGEPVSRVELEDALYRQFPGELTPEAGLIDLITAVYADEHDGVWYWHADDLDDERSHAFDVLTRLGERLEFAVVRDVAPFELAWQADGKIAHGFVWRERVPFTDLAPVKVTPASGYLIVPEPRVAFVREKVRRLPQVAEAFNKAGWNFVRVRFAEHLLNEETIERNDVALMVGLMPPVAEASAQLGLFRVE